MITNSQNIGIIFYIITGIIVLIFGTFSIYNRHCRNKIQKRIIFLKNKYRNYQKSYSKESVKEDLEEIEYLSELLKKTSI